MRIAGTMASPQKKGRAGVRGGEGEGARDKEQEGVWEDLWALEALERHVDGVI